MADRTALAKAISDAAARKPVPRPSTPLAEVLADALQHAGSGYMKRQGEYARQGWDQANQGNAQIQAGDIPSGIVNSLMGPVNWLSSPLNALVPNDKEIYSAGQGSDLGRAIAPALAAGAGLAMVGMPGPGGKRGLGRGLGDLAGDIAPTEAAALRVRLEAEAGAGNAAKQAPSLEDLHSRLHKDSQGVTSGPDGKPFWTPSAYGHEMDRARITIGSNSLKVDPLEASLKKALISKDAQSAAKIREKINAIRAESAAAQKRMDFLQAWRRGEADPLPPEGP